MPAAEPRKRESKRAPVAVAPTAAPQGRGQWSMTPGGLCRLTVYFAPEEREALRHRAFEQRVSHGELVRRAVRSYLGL
jgi:hypothetical protein